MVLVVRLAFGDFELDVERFELRRLRQPIRLQRKVFDLLRYLAERSDRVVTRQELLDAVWPGIRVSDSALLWSVSQARKALGQRRGEESPIETLHGRGYRLRADVRRIDTPRNPESILPPRAAIDPPELSEPFVGRTELLERATLALDQAQQGRGGVLLFTGESGIGKTRCAEELERRARSRGVHVAWGRCWEGEESAALWPWIQVLRSLSNEGNAPPAIRDGALDLLARITPARARELSELPLEDGGEFWALDALREILVTLARSSALLVVLDDLHWADELSIRALSLVAQATSREPLLVVATLRDQTDGAKGPIAGALRRLARNATFEAVTALQPAEVAEYVEHAHPGAGSISEAVASALHAHTGGNALMLREVVRDLAMRYGPDAFARVTPESLGVPEPLRRLVEYRLDDCTEDVRRVLGIASVVGQSFDLADVAAVTSIQADTLVAALEHGIDLGLVVEAAGFGRFRFVHGLVRQALYDSLPQAERRAHHLAIATAIEKRAAGDDHVHHVAFHLHRALPAGDPRMAAEWAARAAVAAAHLYAYEDAVRDYGWALEACSLVTPPSPRLRAELLLGLAGATRRTGVEMDARRHAEEAIEIAHRHDFGDLLVLGARRLRPTLAWRRAPDKTARRALERALEILPERETALRASALSALAGTPPYSLSPERSRELSDRARNLATTLGQRSRLDALRSAVFSRTGPDDVADLLAITDEMLDLDGGETWHSADARYVRFPALIYRGDMKRAEDELEEFGRLARHFRLSEGTWNYERNRAQFWFCRGDYSAAEAAWRDLSERPGAPWYAGLLLPSHLALLERDRSGASPLDAPVWNQLWDAARAAPRLKAARALHTAEAGQSEQARAQLETLLAEGIEAIPRDLDFLATIADLADVAVLIGEPSRATQLYDVLIPYATFTTPDVFCFNQGVVALHLGRLARLLHREHEAKAHLELAATRNLEIGLLPRAAVSELELAELIAAMGGAIEEALSRATRAHDVAERLGMAPLRARAQAFIGRLKT